jgi:hypothetical protein
MGISTIEAAELMEYADVYPEIGRCSTRLDKNQALRAELSKIRCLQG